MTSTIRQVSITHESWPLTDAFNISRESKKSAEVIRIDISQEGITGQGECVPYKRYGENGKSVETQIEAIKPHIETGANRQKIDQLMPAGAARNAVDCALWDLECKLSGIPAWKKAGVPETRSLITAFTISLDTPERMASKAGEATNYPILKIKLGADDGLDALRITGIRKSCPNTRLIIDANEGWKKDNIEELLAICAKEDIELVEQPLPSTEDSILSSISHPVAICADESIHLGDNLEELLGRYDWVNIKLDKTGGLSEGLRTIKLAQELGFKVMVGCMVGTSLAIAPALILAQKADLVDLDGPLWLKKDRENAITYKNGEIHGPYTGLWGNKAK